MKNRIVNIVFLLVLISTLIADIFLNVPVSLYVILIIAYVTIQAYGSIVLSANFFIPAIIKGNVSNAVALTFDDGPVAGMTDRILDILKQHEVKGTFFLIGKNATENSALVKQIHADGHIVGNHSFYHGKFFDLQSAAAIYDELKKTDTVLNNIIGRQPRFFRPPYGVTNPMVANAIRKGKYTTVGWTVRSFDTVTKDGGKLLEKLTKERMKSGDIVLFHDYSESMISILPEFIKRIKAQGLQFVTLDKLLNEKAYV